MKSFLFYIFILILILFGKAPLFAQPTTASSPTLNLSNAIELAIKNNLDIQRRGLQAETEKVFLQQAKSNKLPTLNAEYSQGIRAGRSIDPSTNAYVNERITTAYPEFRSNLTLFNGLALLNTIRRNSLAFQAAQMEAQQAKDDITLRVILAYLQVLTNRDLLELSKTQRETSLKQFQRLEILNKEGAVSPGEYFDLKGQVANEQMAVVNAANNLENAKMLLAQLLNIPYRKDIQLENLNAEQFSLVYQSSPEQVYQEALQHLAMIKAVDLREKSASENIKVAKSNYSPSLFLNGALSSNYSSAGNDQAKNSYSTQLRNNLSKTVSVGVAIPIINSFRAKNLVSLAKIDRKEAELTAQTTRTQVQQLTEQAYFNMESAKERYLALQEQVAAFSESFRTTEARFNAGAINSVDYLVVKANLDRANLNMIASRYDFILRKKVLDFYQGKPLQ